MAYVVAGVIVILSAVIGGMLTWWFMDGRVSFWREKYSEERRLRDRLVEASTDIAERQLQIIDDLRVAFSSGYGDGLYPVYAEYNDDGRIVRVTIDMR